MHLYGRYKIKKLKTIYDHIVIYLFAFVNVKQTIKIWINYVKSILFNACSVSDDMIGFHQSSKSPLIFVAWQLRGGRKSASFNTSDHEYLWEIPFSCKSTPRLFYIHKKPFIWLTLNTTFSYSSVDKQGICDVCFSFQTIGCFALRAVAE